MNSSQLLTYHSFPQLSTSRPTIQNFYFSQKSHDLKSGFCNPKCSSYFYGVQLGRIGPRIQKCEIFSSGCSKISFFRNYKLAGKTGLRFHHNTNELCAFRAVDLVGSYYEVNLRNKRFISRSSSVLNRDKVVEKGKSDEDNYYDAIVIGSGIGGLVAATQLAVKGARVLVLEKYVIPGGSSGYYQRNGYTFDVGSSVMFGFSDKVCFSVNF